MVITIINLSLPSDNPNRVIEIVGYMPTDGFTETLSEPNFEPVDIDGRSSPIAYYTGGGSRKVSFTIALHRDMVAPETSAVRSISQPAGIGTSSDPSLLTSVYRGLFLGNSVQNDTTLAWLNQGEAQLEERFKQDLGNSYRQELLEEFPYLDHIDRENAVNAAAGGESSLYKKYWSYHNSRGEKQATVKFQQFLDRIKALNYPVYTSYGIVPPKVYLLAGGQKGFGGIKLKGYCTARINYDGLVKFDTLISTSVTFDFTEVLDRAWSATEIIQGMPRYGLYMDPYAGGAGNLNEFLNEGNPR